MTNELVQRDPAVARVSLADVLSTVEQERVAVDKILMAAESLEVTDDRTFQEAGSLLTTIKGQMKRISGARDGIVKPVREGIAYIDSLFKPLVGRLEAEGEKVLKGRILHFMEEQDRARRQAEAEARRQAAERQAELDREAIRKAEEARAAGNETKAAEIEASTPIVVAPILSQETEKPAGIGLIENWKWEVQDEKLIPDDYWILDEKLIGRVVRASKEKTNIPGIRVFVEKGVSARSK